MMEPFQAFTELDPYGRLVIVSSTQIPFHVRRIVATALEIPKSRVRVIKPRIGGGFGAKQTAVMECYPALVTMVTGKRAYMLYTREESQTVSSPRHEAEIHVRIGASKERAHPRHFRRGPLEWRRLQRSQPDNGYPGRS